MFWKASGSDVKVEIAVNASDNRPAHARTPWLVWRRGGGGGWVPAWSGGVLVFQTRVLHTGPHCPKSQAGGNTYDIKLALNPPRKT